MSMGCKISVHSCLYCSHFLRNFTVTALKMQIHHQILREVDLLYTNFIIHDGFWKKSSWICFIPCTPCTKSSCFQGGISSSVLSVFFTDKFALSQSDARISVAYKICQWKTLTKHLMKYPPDLNIGTCTTGAILNYWFSLFRYVFPIFYQLG